MNRIAKKLVLPITIVIILVTIISVLSNILLTGYLTVKKEEKQLDTIYQQLAKSPSADVKTLEQDYNVAILHFGNQEKADAFNDEFRTALTENNIGYTKLWLWEEDFTKLKNKGTLTRTYNQGWLHYSIMVKYTMDDSGIWAIVMNLPDTTQTLALINKSNILVFLAGGAVIVLVIILLIKRITKPLSTLSKAADKVGTPAFKKIELQTKDEIADLAQSFNTMSERLHTSQKQLEAKNQDMQELLAGVAHEIKTPAALIKAYVSGIQDGMDDGTFLAVIDDQSTQISQMTEALITLSGSKQEPMSAESVNLSQLTEETLKGLKMLARERQIICHTEIESDLIVWASADTLGLVLQNLITNAAKYSLSQMTVRLQKEENKAVLKVINDLDNPHLDTIKIWDPFYVGEASRSKSLSGTGLGLAVVRSKLEAAGVDYGCVCGEGDICFYVKWPLDCED